MRKRIFSFIILILVAVCGVTLVSCGRNSGENVSISVSEGLDTQLSSNLKNDFSDELRLSSSEKNNFVQGKGYLGSVSGANAVSLIVDDEGFGSREIIVQIGGFFEGMGKEVFFSTDSNCISISKVEYLSNGKAKVTITANSSGTAEVFVKTGQFGKTTSFVVKCLTKLERFSAKTNAIIYLEKGKTLEINPDTYFNFYPAESNLRDLEFFDGDVCLMKNGKTILSTADASGVTGVIETSREISVRATRLSGTESMETISVVVVDSLDNLQLKKTIYNNSGAESYVELGERLTVLQNVTSKGGVSYGVRKVYAIVDCNEDDLKIFARAISKGEDLGILIVPTAIERITQENFSTAKFKNLVDGTREEFSTYVFEFEFKFEGYSEYDVKFNFKVGEYKYSENMSSTIEFKTGSSLIELKKVGQEAESNEYLIYDYYSGTYGTAMTISIGRSDLFSQSKISLELGDADIGNFIFITRAGKEKEFLTFSSGETFFVKAKTALEAKEYTVTAKVSFAFEGVDFETEKNYIFNVQKSPTEVKLISGTTAISSHNFDLNTTGKVLGQESYTSRKTLVLDVCGFAGSAQLGTVSDFEIISTTGIVQATKDGSTIKLTAIDTGTGKIEVILGNGVRTTFTFEVIRSVSSAKISLPDASQNSNLIAVLNNYSHEGTIYDQYVIAKTNSQIPLIISATGNFTSEISVADDVKDKVTINGKFIATTEFSKAEVKVKITFKKIDENGKIVEVTEYATGKILLSAITQIDLLTIKANKGSNFNLYDYSSVGYFSKNLATAEIYVDVVPSSIKEAVFEAIVWTTNMGEFTKISNGNSDVYTCEIFSFEFFKTGENAGRGIITCNVDNMKLFDENGNLNLGRVTLSASVARSSDVANSKINKNIHFNVKCANKVEVIACDKNAINLDPYSNKDQLLVSTFPINATNKSWNYVFIPTTSGLSESDVLLTQNGDVLTIELKNTNAKGKGILRLIAFDSYSTINDYTTFVEIPLSINDGSEDYPYHINSDKDIEKLVETNFEKYYVVSGEFDLTKYDWSGKVLSGTITNDGKAVFKTTLKSTTVDNEIYAGLFKEITGKISGIKLEVSFNLDFKTETSKRIFVGGFAGINSGSIENASVEIKENSSVSVGKNSLYFGGVVAHNVGTITNEITKNSLLTTLVSGKFKISCEQTELLVVGGVVGLNNGTIKRTIEEGLVEFNNSFATANISMEISCDQTNTNSCIGAVAGKSTNLLDNLESVGTVSAPNFDNVGGIVGDNSGTIQNCLSQTVVIGHDNVGGAVGTNSGTIDKMIVESLEKKSSVTLVSGNDAVGGIVGNMTGGSLKDSSMISYLSNLEAIDVKGANNFGLVVGAQSAGATIDYVVAIADGFGTPISISAAHYAIFNKSDNTPTSSKGIGEGVTKENIKDIEGFGFIFLPSNAINMELDSDKQNNKMTSDGGNVAFYIYLKKDKDGNFSTYFISSFLTTSLGNRYLIESRNSAILEIANGCLCPKEIGEVVLTVSSPYVSASQTIYVKVVSFINNISIYLDREKTSEIENESEVNFDAQISKILYLSLLDKYNLKGFEIPTDIKFLIKIGDKMVKPGSSSEYVFDLVQIDSETYQISVKGKVGEYDVTILPYVEFVGEDGKTYFATLNFGVDENTKTKIECKFKFENTTKGIGVSKNTIETEPYYVTEMDVSLDSIKSDEKITIEVSELDSAGNIIVDPETLYLELTVRFGENVFKNKKGETFNYNFNFNINCKKNKTFSIKFKLDDEGKAITSTKIFKVKISALNGVSSSMIITYQPQSVISVSSNLYSTISKEEEKYGFSGRFSYIPSGVIIPGQHSLLELSVTPGFTYFETVEIVNVSGNQYNLAFDLFDRTSDSPLAGGKRVGDGIQINRNLIKDGKFFVRIFADQRMADNSQASLKIIFRDENGNQNGDEILKTFIVERLPGVILTVDGVSSGNEQSNPLKLAQGISYDLDVNVKGFSFGTFVGAGNLYTDGQICFEVTGNGAGFVTIVKNDDGTYKLVVKDELPVGARTLEIKTYGVDIDGEKSQEAVLYIELVQFVVKENNFSDIVYNVFNDIYSSAIGNSYTLEISLNSNILIYNKSNEIIRRNVLEFLSKLTTEGTWSFKDGDATWNNIIGNNKFTDGIGFSKVYTTSKGGFKISYNEETKKIVIKFLKVHTPSSPELEIKFFARFHYTNKGLPEIYSTGTENAYVLSQEFTFDISEKTTLRNPYPLYSYDDMKNMREGNYYILMKDITLPDDFVPIETLIGGFDGNNHRIILPHQYSLKAEESNSITFGLFKTTSESALLKNIIIYVKENTNLNLYDFTTVTFGLLVGENNGKITNCSIQGDSLAIMNLNLFGIPDSTQITNQVGGLVGINLGDITNSRVEAGISLNATGLSSSSTTGYLPANLGGIAAINGGSASVASCYVMARLENNTAGSVSAITGGVVGVNQLGGTIFSSYITSGNTDKDMFPEEVGGVNIIYSTASASAFVYENFGQISNCYSNIPVISNESASGFVFNNQSEGVVTHCYSTSALQSSAKNGVFVGFLTGVSENPILNTGKIIECFAVEENTKGNTEGNTEENTEENTEGNTEGSTKGKKFNSGLGGNVVDGLTILTSKDKFNKQDTFKKFAFSNTADKTAGVWFWANNNFGESDFKDEDGRALSFSAKAPQLVSPNVLTFGHQTLVNTIFDSETETTEYIYEYDENYLEGSKFNPYIISSQEDLEFLVNSNSGFTSGVIIKEIYCRLIGDIIYETSTVSSGLYQYTFLGNFEGNGYTIGNYVLDSGAKRDNAGFFGTIGLPSQVKGSVKNLTFAPRYISLANCNSVGAVAGAVYGATLVNITVDGSLYASELDGVTVLGKNTVGGVCGIAEGEFNFNNIISNISVNATYRSSLNNHPYREYLLGNLNQVSYAGLISGVTNGYGKVVYAYVSGNNVSAAENAGLMFGYNGRNVIAQNLEVIGAIGQKVKADIYGGVIAGHNLGTIEDVVVLGDDGSAYSGFFATENFSPTAIGNVAGYMTNGTIKDVLITTKLKVKTDVISVGGAVGFMTAGRLENVVIVGDIIGGSRIGGVIGLIKTENSSKVSIIDTFHSGTITSTTSEDLTSVGTLVASISGYTKETVGISKDISENDSNLNKTVNIVLREDFKKKIEQKLASGVYTSKIVINNYSISESLQVWYGNCVCENASTYKKELLEDKGGILSIYNVDKEGITKFIPLTNKYQENGTVTLK